MTGLDVTIGELFTACERSAVHLEMRDAYSTEDPVFQDWRAGISVDPASRWREWFDLVSSTTARGVQIMRARIISEPISAYIRYEYEITDGLNITAGEQVRWLPRRGASDLALPGNDFWVFDHRLVALNHFGGEGEWLDIELSTDPAMVKLCVAAFEAVWERATPHADYHPA
ncbi:DUF6879 family protein [Phytohabitans sp. LJ34]|uniref:DUF6879 family protein n=1 Tax=Phytohabitans sp. LJ34 TaxID=3452217 RepID=UPI003F8C56DF